VHKARKYSILSFCLALIFIYAGCGSARKLKDNELLLKHNSIRTTNTALNKDEILTYIRQKPNRKIFFFYPFYLEIYNLVNQDKLKAHKLRREARIDTINEHRKENNLIRNEKRRAQGRAEKAPKLKSKDKLSFREWVANIGEEPSIFDSAGTRKSSRQISLYLNNKGYFNNTVKDSFSIKGQKIKVFYIIKTPAPYKIRHIAYELDDSAVARYVMADTSRCLIRTGQNLDVDLLQKERDRITKMLKNNGYYYFDKEYIYYNLDTALKSHQLDLSLGIKRRTVTSNLAGDSTVEKNHQRYRIKDIYIITDYQGRNDTIQARDTFRTKNGFTFLFSKILKYKTGVLENAIYMHKGEEYEISKSEDTYKRLAQLRAFKQIIIDFSLADDPDDGLLNCFIKLSPVAKQTLGLGAEGTNTGGNLGVDGSVAYQNKNALRGAEVFEIKAKGALEVQQLVANIGSEQTKKTFLPFNTFEYGPEFNLYVPRPLFPFNLFPVGKSASPRTTFTSYYNFQHRPDFTRSILNVGYSYDWRKGLFKKFTLFPFEVNFVRLLKIDPAFQNYLNTNNDLYLKTQFQSHITTDTRWTYLYTNQQLKTKKDYIYFRLDLESSGTVLRSLAELSNSLHIIDIPKDTNGSYRIEQIKFSQYVKGGFDLRYYKLQTESNKLVFRTAAGLGVPFHNLTTLPFEKSYYAGGPNGIRAFPARTLGPGSYNSGGTLFELGDMSIEANIEYRYKIFKMLNAAIFVDAGNIWLLRPDPGRPGGDFDPNRFYKEFAVGTGAGLRLDFDFFIIRLDAGVPLRDPSAPVNDRWEFDKRPLTKTVLNFGIGYPF
jgi:outer membrane translocation and assembly module TamA